MFENFSIENCKSIATEIGKELQNGGMSLDVTNSVAQEFAQSYHYYISSNKNFGDIYRNGPQNMQESALLISAMAFLDSSQLQEAISSNKPIAEVATAIEHNKAIKMNEAAQHQAVDENHIPAKEQAEKLPSLNVSYGVLNEAATSLMESVVSVDDASMDDVKQPSCPASSNPDVPNRCK